MNIRDGGIKEELERDGYSVVRKVFSAEEIALMRGEAISLLATNDRPVNGGVVCGPVPRESDLARRLLHDERLASHSGGRLPCQIHVHADTFSYWHADGEPPDQTSVSSGDTAWMCKVVIYLQDHPDRAGFSVVPGSHRQGNTPRAPLHVGTFVGDVVVFEHCVRHAGRLPNRLIAEFAWLQHRLGLISEKGYHVFRFQRLLQPTPAAERLAIFLSYAPLYDIPRRYTELKRSSLN